MLQQLTGLVGLSKQIAKGSPAASATYGLGLSDGKVFNLDIDQEPAPLTLPGAANDRFAPHADRTGAHPGAAFTTRAWPQSLPLLLYSALGTLTTTGASAPFSHAASPAIDLPYLTLFGRLDDEYTKLPDCKMDELTISWGERNPLEVEAALMGLVPAFGVSAWSPTNDETDQTYFGPVGGTFLLDAGSGTPVAARVSGASLHIANNLNEVPLSASTLPDDLVPGSQVVDGTITLIPQDLAEWRKVVTGTSGGAAYSEDPIYGSFDLLVALDASTDARFQAFRVPMLIEFPDVGTGGGPAEIECAFAAVRPTDGSDAFTATVRNAVASY